MASKQHRKVRRGFTLIELVIVIAVIAILAALLVPTILGQSERARISRAKGDVAEIAKAFARMRNDTAFTGTQAQLDGCFDLVNLTSATAPAGDKCGPVADLPACNPATPDQAKCWGGPYLSSSVTPVDPWGTAYTRSVNPTTRAITVTSLGSNKAVGGTAGTDQADISVTQ